MINVAVLGAKGRMGAEVVKAVNSDPGMSLIAALDLGDSLNQLLGSGTHVVVDFTTPDSVMANLDFLINNGINVVVGTTGFDDKKLAIIDGLCTANPSVGVLIAPNFAIGAVLMMEFAAKAARYFESGSTEHSNFHSHFCFYNKRAGNNGASFNVAVACQSCQITQPHMLLC